MKVSERKVNRPRLTLRKKQGKTVAPYYRGIVPLLIRKGVDFSWDMTPEQLMTDFSQQLFNDQTFKLLDRGQLVRLRAYLKLLDLEDYTRESNEPSKRKASTRNAGSDKAERKQRVGKSVVPVRPVDAQQRKR